MLEDYRKAGMPAVHHSDRYRRAYAPAYRVVEQDLARLLPLLSALLYLLSALLLFDSSWFSFTFLYAVLSFAGHGAGRWLRRMIEREQTAGKNV